MVRACIVTDTSVQFTQPIVLLEKIIFQLPLWGNSDLLNSESKRESSETGRSGFQSPSDVEINHLFSNLSQKFSDILVITLSSALSDLSAIVEKVIHKNGDDGHIQVIDSHTTSVGLGLLVQMAANMILQGASPGEIEHQLRISVPHIYSIFCLPDLSYLVADNFLSNSQAIVGEMLDLLPIFSLEGDCLTALQKVRTQRHLLETFQEFVDEFTDPAYIALIKNGSQLKAPPFRDYVANTFPGTRYSEHQLGNPLIELLGPHSVGLIVMDGHSEGLI